MQNTGYAPTGIACPRCGNHNINIQVVQTGAKTSTKGKGCLFGLGRLCLIVFTCGLWLLFGKKKASSRTTFSSEKQAICQGCGHSWTV